MYRRLLALIICLPVLAVAQTAPQPDKLGPQMASVEAGVICATDSGETLPAPGTIAGTTHVMKNEPPFVAVTRRVPAVHGIGFGVKSRAQDVDGVDSVTMIITHPPMGDRQTQSQSFGTRINGDGPSLTFYQFDYDYELVPGIWQVTAMKDGRVLYRTTFEVVPPQLMPELAAVCGFEHLLS